MLNRLFGRNRPDVAPVDDVSEITMFGDAAQEEFVDLEALCARLGVTLDDQPFRPDLNGTLERRSAGWFICVNSGLGLHQRRFTIAHEIAHYLMHRDLVAMRDGPMRVTDDRNHRQMEGLLHNPHILPEHETQANRMAFQLLMGERKMRRLMEEGLDAGQIGPLIGMPIRTVEVRLRGLREPTA